MLFPRYQYVVRTYVPPAKHPCARGFGKTKPVPMLYHTVLCTVPVLGDFSVRIIAFLLLSLGHSHCAAAGAPCEIARGAVEKNVRFYTGTAVFRTVLIVVPVPYNALSHHKSQSCIVCVQTYIEILVHPVLVLSQLLRRTISKQKSNKVPLTNSGYE